VKAIPVQVRAKDADGRVYGWKVFREDRGWFLVDHDGYRRTLEATWRESVPRIRAIAENYGFTVEVS
jgi:hypothetical protein